MKQLENHGTERLRVDDAVCMPGDSQLCLPKHHKRSPYIPPDQKQLVLCATFDVDAFPNQTQPLFEVQHAHMYRGPFSRLYQAVVLRAYKKGGLP